MSKTEDSAPAAGVQDANPISSTADKADLAGAARTSAGKGIWMGTAVGIGSAAIVAALLYARKKT
jgi:hypothetical protein